MFSGVTFEVVVVIDELKVYFPYTKISSLPKLLLICPRKGVSNLRSVPPSSRLETVSYLNHPLTQNNYLLLTEDDD